MPASRVVIVVAGEALIDLVVTAGAITATPGGAPYNVARTCGRLGAPVALLAAVSSDGFGRRLAAELADAGVAASLLQATDRPTTLALAEVDATGTATYRFYVEGTSAASLSPSAMPADASVLVTGGLGLVLEPMATVIESSVRRAPSGVLVVVDVNCRPAIVGDRAAYLHRVEQVLSRVDVVKVSDADLAWMRPDEPPVVAARELLARGPAVALVTRGDGPTSIVTAAGEVSVPVAPVPVVDTIGAGDAFTAGFASWWLTSGQERADLGAPDPSDLLRAGVAAAHAVAAVVVGRRGADPPTLADLPRGWPDGS